MLPSMPGWAFGADGRRRAVAVPVDHAHAAARARCRSRSARSALASRRRRTCWSPATAGIWRVVGDDGTPLLLRDRAGDYVREPVRRSVGLRRRPGRSRHARRSAPARATPASPLIAQRRHGVAAARDPLGDADRLGRADPGLRRGRHRRLRPLAAARLHAALAQARPRRRWRAPAGSRSILAASRASRRVADRVGAHPWAQCTPASVALHTASSLPDGSMKWKRRPPGKVKIGLAIDAAGLGHGVERRLEIVDADHRQRRRQARRPDRPAGRRRSCRWSSRNRSGRNR